MNYENIQGTSRVGHGVLPEGTDAPEAGSDGDPLLSRVTAHAGQPGNDFAGGWRPGPLRHHDGLSDADDVQGSGLDPACRHAAEGELLRLERARRQRPFSDMPRLWLRHRTAAARSTLGGNRTARLRARFFTGAIGLRSLRPLRELSDRAQNSHHAIEIGCPRQNSNHPKTMTQLLIFDFIGRHCIKCSSDQ